VIKDKYTQADIRKLAARWDDEYKGVMSADTVDSSESRKDKAARIRRLEADDEAWFAYYFSKYATAPPAAFHEAATRRLMGNDRWFEVRAWSRELAKSTRAMEEIIKLAVTGRIHNVLLVSNSHDNAVRLLNPFITEFEKNLRLRNDYGDQRMPGDWGEDEFSIRKGCAFRAIGAGQSPRGTRKESYRPDFILVDDIDTDEDCRNPETIRKKWDWVERALLPTMSVSGNYRILFNGNIIAKDCCVVRAMAKADKTDIVNIRDKDGHSSWPEKNSEEDIDRFLSLMSTAAAQAEYFNNPVSDGEIFKNRLYGKVPPLKDFRFLVAYGDPATSNNKSKASSTKALVLVGRKDDKFYVIKAFLDRSLNAEFIGWYFELRDYVAGKVPVYYYIENNTLQDPFYEQVFRPLLREEQHKRPGIAPLVQGDARKKMDKASRIEANLEPLDRAGKLVFNAAEKDNPHMRRLVEQFELFSLQLSFPADGPDAVEGAVQIIKDKTAAMTPSYIVPRQKLKLYRKNRL
jgi:hypothetical protein